MRFADASELELWAFSGAMALTGARGGPPMVGPGNPASAILRSLEKISATAFKLTGSEVVLPDVRVLGERAATLGLSRNGPRSCGGSFRTVRTMDGYLGLSLPRPSDVEMIPALVGASDPDSPWAMVKRWAAGHSTSDAAERCRLLGLACAVWSSAPRADIDPQTDRGPILATSGGRRPLSDHPPLVVDLTSLWAGPLCAHLLSLCGAEIVKVEGLSRPDGARLGPPAFYDLLHGGHASVALNFSDPGDVAALRALIERADIVLESSRPRALEQIGINARELVDTGTIWLSITARGRASNTIGFGDDVAVDAGLAVNVDGYPTPSSDALADPLTGVRAAAAAYAALLEPHGQLIDVSMFHVAAEAAASGPPQPHRTVFHDGLWAVESDAGIVEVRLPHARPVADRASDVGADNTRYLQ